MSVLPVEEWSPIEVRRKFVRGLALTVLPSDAVALGAKEGIKFNLHFVNNERVAMRKEAESKGAKVKKVAKGRVLSEEGKFIRTQGFNVPAETVVSRAAVAGLTISKKQVYGARVRMARMNMKPHMDAPVKKTPRKAARVGSPKRIPYPEVSVAEVAALKLPVEMSVTHEFFRLLAAEIGLSRAMEILQEQKDKLIAHIRQAAE